MLVAARVTRRVRPATSVVHEQDTERYVGSVPRPTSSSAGKWADALTIVSIVALGVCVAAVVERGAPPGAAESRVAAAVTTTPEPTPEPPAEPVDATYRTPEATFPTVVQGCDVVEAPSENSLTWGQIVTSEDAYDNPQYPWYSGKRSVMMTDAVAEALPNDVTIEFGSQRETLVFQPIPETSVEPGEEYPPGWAMASGEIGRGDKIGTFAVSVARDDSGVPPCVAGAVQRRTTEADGTVVDVNETWSEYGDTRTNYRTVVAYTPDGSQIFATSSDAEGFQSTNEGERDILLTFDELERFVRLPELRVTAAVPSSTPEPTSACDNTFGFTSGSTPIDADLANSLNDVLAGIDIDEQFDRGLDTLVLADFSTDVVCTHVNVLNTGADLSISIRGGQEVPELPDIYDPAYRSRPLETDLLDGGAVLQIDESPYSYSPAEEGKPNGGLRRTVTVTYPSGTEVQVRSHAEDPDEPLGADKLRTIATADGLDVL